MPPPPEVAIPVRSLPSVVFFAIVLVGCSGDVKPDTPIDTGCNITVSTVDTPRVMLPRGGSCFYIYEFFIKPAATELEVFELETTRIDPKSDDTVPERIRVGVVESKDDMNPLFEDFVRLAPAANDVTMYDNGKGLGWRGVFEPDPPLPMPEGFWFVELLTPLENCDDTLEITMTYEDVVGSDCGDETTKP